MAFVALTTLTLNSVFHLPAFSFHASRSYRACVASDGMMETKLDASRVTYDTMTLWQDRQSMAKFVAHPHHLRAMKWSRGKSTGKIYHYETAALPTWLEAHDLLDRLGRMV